MTAIAFLLVVLGSLAIASGQINPSLVNEKVERTIDLQSHLVKISSTITVKNTGSSAADSYHVALDPLFKGKLGFIGAKTKTEKGGDDEKNRLEVEQISVPSHKDYQFYRVKFSPALAAGASKTFILTSVYGHALTPHPAQISQKEKQLVIFDGNAYFFSPYKTTTQQTTLSLPSGKVESHTKVNPTNKKDKEIVYGEYSNVDAFKQEAIRAHYENNSPFLAVSSILRHVEVSHWGNIAIEETIDIYHHGAKLKGPFSRYDYQRAQDGYSSVKSFKTMLPAAARDVYYRDEIGNISTSNLLELEDQVELELRPRFPLFGGWKSHYTIGYNIPSYEYLYNKGNQYVLRMRLVDHIYDDQWVEQAMMYIILPEGASNIELSTPYPVQRSADQLHYTYLDTTGKPKLVLNVRDTVEQHIQELEVRYTFQRYALVRKPMILVAAFYLLFTFVIIVVRLDFTIQKDVAKESRMRVQSVLEEVQSLQDRRTALYQSYEDEINRYKQNKDQKIFLQKRKTIDDGYKDLDTKIVTLMSHVKAESVDDADRIQEINRTDQEIRNSLQGSIGLAEKLVAGKVNKQAYMDQETAAAAKRKEWIGKIDGILATF